MYELNLSSPSSNYFLYLKFYLGQFFVFDFKESCELVDNELTVHIEFDFSGSKFDASADAVQGSLILCLIIGCDAEIFVSALYGSAISISDIHPNPGRTRIVSCSPISVDFEFHFFVWLKTILSYSQLHSRFHLPPW